MVMKKGRLVFRRVFQVGLVAVLLYAVVYVLVPQVLITGIRVGKHSYKANIRLP